MKWSFLRHLTVGRLADIIRAHPLRIFGGFFIAVYSLFGDLRDLLTDIVSNADEIIGAPDHLWARWIFVGLGLGLIGWGAVRSGSSEEMARRIAKEQGEVDRRETKALIVDATRLTSMLGERATHQRAMESYCNGLAVFREQLSEAQGLLETMASGHSHDRTREFNQLARAIGFGLDFPLRFAHRKAEKFAPPETILSIGGEDEAGKPFFGLDPSQNSAWIAYAGIWLDHVNSYVPHVEATYSTMGKKLTELDAKIEGEQGRLWQKIPRPDPESP